MGSMKQRWICAAVLGATASAALGQVQHGIMNVVENDGGNTPASVTVTRAEGGDGAWIVIGDDGTDNSNRGDYVPDFGTAMDNAMGILMTSVYQLSRVEKSVGPDPYFATVAAARSGSGRYFAAVNNSPVGNEVNYNIALGYFPIADGWVAGAAYNAQNGGVITELVGHPEIVLTNPFDGLDPATAFEDFSNGTFNLRIDGYDLRRDGVLLVCGGKNEDNYASFGIGIDGSATIYCHDNGANGTSYEQDPVAFVFVPAGTPNVVMGRITGSAQKLFHQGDFTIENFDAQNVNGTFRLTIAGETPSTGTLLVAPVNEGSGNTIDNPIWVEPDGDGWKLESRDLTGMGLQNLGTGDVAFHFVFFKNTGTPGTILPPMEPARPYLDRIDNIQSARFDVMEVTPDNGVGDVRTVRSIGSDALDIYGDNRADFGISYLGARLSARLDNSQDTLEGFVIANSTEFIVDNSLTGGISGWTTVSFDNSEAHHHNASASGGEINSDFSVALFPASLGLLNDADIPTPDGTAVIAIGDDDALMDGVLLATNWDNNNRIAAASPNGGQYDLTVYEGVNGAISTDSVEYGYLYLPYEFVASTNATDGGPGLVAGHVAADGSILSGTGFTTGTGFDGDTGIEVITINIPGVDANAEGVLVITATDGPYAVTWQPAANGDFQVAGLELTAGLPGRTGFMFCYVPDEVVIDLNEIVPGDLNCDGVVSVGDINPFVLALTDAAAYEAMFPDCNILNGDCSEDGQISVGDINCFVALVTGS